MEFLLHSYLLNHCFKLHAGLPKCGIVRNIHFFFFVFTVLVFFKSFYCSVIVVPIPPRHHSPLIYPPPTFHFQSYPHHRLCPWVLYTCSWTWPFPFFPHYSPLSSPLVTVSLFFISMSLILFCWLVCFVKYPFLISLKKIILKYLDDS